MEASIGVFPFRTRSINSQGGVNLQTPPATKGCLQQVETIQTWTQSLRLGFFSSASLARAPGSTKV